MPDPVLALLVFALLAAGAVGLFWPAGGLVGRIRRFTNLDERVRLEDAIKHIYMCQRTRQHCSLDSLAGRLGVSRARGAAGGKRGAPGGGGGGAGPGPPPAPGRGGPG
ncbi:MAG: hypothetical protein OXM87_11345, partial [Truepera sp.]|nr:hypothetical protein [Truepera sp.]